LLFFHNYIVFIVYILFIFLRGTIAKKIYYFHNAKFPMEIINHINNYYEIEDLNV